ncbi:hypothetical protein WJX81_002972 [Elliptochloris bilobata]|uniref:Amino acid transporter transmembrane domain-containing protein n=1 Tax=Elliptochloris bilobata TaxID=381761 RepID=A0AAW1QXU7_9CHLO
MISSLTARQAIWGVASTTAPDGALIWHHQPLQAYEEVSGVQVESAAGMEAASLRDDLARSEGDAGRAREQRLEMFAELAAAQAALAAAKQAAAKQAERAQHQEASGLTMALELTVARRQLAEMQRDVEALKEAGVRKDAALAAAREEVMASRIRLLASAVDGIQIRKERVTLAEKAVSNELRDERERYEQLERMLRSVACVLMPDREKGSAAWAAAATNGNEKRQESAPARKAEDAARSPVATSAAAAQQRRARTAAAPGDPAPMRPSGEDMRGASGNSADSGGRGGSSCPPGFAMRDDRGESAAACDTSASEAAPQSHDTLQAVASKIEDGVEGCDASAGIARSASLCAAPPVSTIRIGTTSSGDHGASQSGSSHGGALCVAAPAAGEAGPKPKPDRSHLPRYRAGRKVKQIEARRAARALKERQAAEAAQDAGGGGVGHAHVIKGVGARRQDAWASGGNKGRYARARSQAHWSCCGGMRRCIYGENQLAGRSEAMFQLAKEVDELEGQRHELRGNVKALQAQNERKAAKLAAAEAHERRIKEQLAVLQAAVIARLERELGAARDTAVQARAAGGEAAALLARVEAAERAAAEAVLPACFLEHRKGPLTGGRAGAGTAAALELDRATAQYVRELTRTHERAAAIDRSAAIAVNKCQIAMRLNEEKAEQLAALQPQLDRLEERTAGAEATTTMATEEFEEALAAASEDAAVLMANRDAQAAAAAEADERCKRLEAELTAKAELAAREHAKLERLQALQLQTDKQLFADAYWRADMAHRRTDALCRAAQGEFEVARLRLRSWSKRWLRRGTRPRGRRTALRTLRTSKGATDVVEDGWPAPGHCEGPCSDCARLASALKVQRRSRERRAMPARTHTQGAPGVRAFTVAAAGVAAERRAERQQASFSEIAHGIGGGDACIGIAGTSTRGAHPSAAGDSIVSGTAGGNTGSSDTNVSPPNSIGSGTNDSGDDGAPQPGAGNADPSGHAAPAPDATGPAAKPDRSHLPRYRAGRRSVGNATFFESVVNVINILSGVGLLSLPFALRKSGWAGLGVLWLMGCVTNYTGKILVQCYDAVAQRKATAAGGQVLPVGYEDVGEAAFGAFGRAVVATSIYTELLGTAALLFILEGDNLFQLFGTRFAPDAGAYMLMAACVMLPTVWLPDLKALSYLGFFGVGATITVLGAVAYTYLSGSFPAGAATAAANWSALPLVFGIMAFVYSGHGVFPSIQRSMKEPSRFPQVLNIAYLAVAAQCTLIAAAGYAMYGVGALDVITFNLPRGLLATLCASLILVNPVAKFALTVDTPAMAAVAAVARATPGAPALARRLAVRTSIGLATLALARYVPFLAYFMALIGSLLTVSVSIIFPAACHLRIFRGEASRARVALNVAVLVIGIACAISGTAASLGALVGAS